MTRLSLMLAAAMAGLGQPYLAHAKPSMAVVCVPTETGIRQFSWAPPTEPPVEIPPRQTLAAWAASARTTIPPRVSRDGLSFARRGRVQIQVPLQGRYRPVAAIEGLPALVRAAGQDNTIFVLTGPTGCWFDAFVLETLERPSESPVG